MSYLLLAQVPVLACWRGWRGRYSRCWSPPSTPPPPPPPPPPVDVDPPKQWLCPVNITFHCFSDSVDNFYLAISSKVVIVIEWFDKTASNDQLRRFKRGNGSNYQPLCLYVCGAAVVRPWSILSTPWAPWLPAGELSSSDWDWAMSSRRLRAAASVSVDAHLVRPPSPSPSAIR